MRSLLIGLPLRGRSPPETISEPASRELAQKGFACSVWGYADAGSLPGSLDLAGLQQTIVKALDESADLIFVGSDVLLFHDTIGRMLEVASSDPMIAFVSPRLNCSSSHALPSAGANDPNEFYARAQRLAKRVLETTYAPNVVAECFYAKIEILRDFGGADSPIDDLVARANRCGYRAAIANRALAYCVRELPQNPSSSPALKGHLASPGERALRLLCQIKTDKPALAFDFSTIGRLKNGTSEYSVALVSAFAKLFADRYCIDVMCGKETWDFHDLAGIPGIRCVAIEDDHPYAAIVRTSQPFTIESLALAPSRGAVTLVVMHDAIAYDCLHLAPADLHQLWSFVMQFSDGVVYVSEFSRQQLARRFVTSPDVAHITCMPSTDVADYAKARPNGGSYLLIVGNDFAHKALLDTVGLIRGRFPALKLGVFGALGAGQDNVVHFPDGQLSSEEVAAIFANASAVIYPSHYEGFGFPIMQALANGKRIFARDLPVYHEIKHKVAAPENIHLFKDNDALLDEIAMADFAWRAPRQTGAAEGWDVAAQHLEALVRDKLQGANAEKIQRRLVALDNLYAGITGRLAQTTLQERVTHLENLAAHRQEHLDTLHSSSSWRITKPLRALGRMLPGRK